MESTFYAGSYNVPGPYFHAQGEGLTVCALDGATGAMRRVVAHPDAQNTHFLARHGDTLAAAMDRYMEPGEATSFTIGGGGCLSRLATRSSCGTIACHAGFSPDGKLAFFANYGDARVSVHAVDAQGGLAPSHQVFTYAGSGPNSARQETAHAHQAVASPDGRWLHVPDLGSDKVWIHPIEGESVGLPVAVDVAPGSGPRHLACHPSLPRVYLLCELDASLRVLDRDQGTGALKEVAVLGTLPEGFSGTPSGAAIHLHPSGRSLVVSNRESDTLTAFSLDSKGHPTRAACWPAGGKTPREFAFSPDGRWLVVCHHDGHTLASFAFEPHTGLPTSTRPAARMALGSPVCVLF